MPSGPSPVVGQEVVARGWTSDLAFTAGNAALGGIAAGLKRSLDGGSFWDGFLGGAVGGGVAYGGRRVAAGTWAGAGLVGREVGAVGGSLMRNAATGRAPLDAFVLPLGVARLYASRNDRRGWRATVRWDVPTLLVVAYLGIRPDADFDAGASVSAGAPVFATHERHADSWQGLQVAGVVWLKGDPWDPWPDSPEAGAMAHERIHVLQYDFSHLAWGEGLDGVVSRRLPHGDWIDAHLDLGLHVGGWSVANGLLPYRLRPWEREAHSLSGATTHPD